MAPKPLVSRETQLPGTDLEPDNATQVVLFMIVFSLLALVAVALRIASKWMRWAQLKWDDGLLVLAIAQMLAINVLFVLGAYMPAPISMLQES